MKKELDKNVENNEDVKKIKSKYKRIIKFGIIFLIIILVIFLINFIKTYIGFSKIMKSNIAVDLGNNYKITTYENGNPMYIYYKDGIKKTIRNEGKDSEFIVLQKQDKAYGIFTKTKKYFEAEITRSVNKTDLIVSMTWDEEYLNFQNFIRVMFTENIKIDKEEYKGKDYIVLTVDMMKLWANPDTYYIEKELRFGDEIERSVEKNVVTTEDVAIPNLDGYEKEESNLMLIR